MRRGRGGIVACALAVLCLAGTGCYSYQRSALPRPDDPDQSLGAYSRITTRSGAIYTLANATVVGDSVIGFTEARFERVAIAVSNVDTVARWGEDGGKSVGLLAGIAGAVVLATVLAAALLLAVFTQS